MYAIVVKLHTELNYYFHILLSSQKLLNDLSKQKRMTPPCRCRRMPAQKIFQSEASCLKSKLRCFSYITKIILWIYWKLELKEWKSCLVINIIPKISFTNIFCDSHHIHSQVELLLFFYCIMLHYYLKAGANKRRSDVDRSRRIWKEMGIKKKGYSQDAFLIALM